MKKRIAEIVVLAVLSLAAVVSAYNAIHGYRLNLERESINQRWEFIIQQYEIQLERLEEYEQERKTSYFAQR